jgi:two-component system sensor histidine kinase UhpB
MGLVAGLRWLVERFNEQHPTQTRFETIGEANALPPEIEITLFRIAQEGLTNIAKHARAEHASIRLDFDDGPSLTVSDDGIGYDPAVVLTNRKTHTAWGLMGMQERASLINATLSVDTHPGAGTRLRVRLNDLKENSDDDAHTNR